MKELETAVLSRNYEQIVDGNYFSSFLIFGNFACCRRRPAQAYDSEPDLTFDAVGLVCTDRGKGSNSTRKKRCPRKEIFKVLT